MLMIDRHGDEPVTEAAKQVAELANGDLGGAAVWFRRTSESRITLY